MGQKVSPTVLRIGIIKNWDSLWFAKTQDFPLFIAEDYKIRRHIKKSLRQAAISKVVIERLSDKIKVKIYSARPGIIIGRHGSDIEKLSDKIKDIVKNNKEVSIDIEEIKQPAVDAQLIAENITFQIEKRVGFRRATKRCIEQAKNAGVGGIKICCSGRLDGAEIARREKYMFGKVPLHTLRADIQYGQAEALTTYGLVGIKVWVYKGDVLLRKEEAPQIAKAATASIVNKEAK